MAVLVGRSHIHLDLCLKSCTSDDEPLADGSGKDICGSRSNWACWPARVDDVVNGDTDGAKVVWVVPVDHWKWHRI